MEDNLKETTKEMPFITRMRQHRPRKINWLEIKEIKVVILLDKLEKKIGSNVARTVMARNYISALGAGHSKRY